MPRDTTWDDVWAEYDARIGATAKPAAAAEPVVVAASAPRLARYRLPRLRGRTLAMAALAMLVAVVLGLPFGDAGAPAIASQEETVPARQTMVVVGLSGDADMSESPAVSPSGAALLMSELAPAQAAPAALATAEPAVPARLSRHGTTTRRLAQQARRHGSTQAALGRSGTRLSPERAARASG